MNPKEKAKELIGKFLPNVYCYLGSGMLTNEYSEEVALSNAKKQALICVDEIIDSEPMEDFGCSDSGTEYRSTDEFWQEVKQEIEIYESTNN